MLNALGTTDRKSTRLNSSHTEIYTLSLHDALPILGRPTPQTSDTQGHGNVMASRCTSAIHVYAQRSGHYRSEEHTSELQSHRDLHSFPTRRSSDLGTANAPNE